MPSYLIYQIRDYGYSLLINQISGGYMRNYRSMMVASMVAGGLLLASNAAMAHDCPAIGVVQSFINANRQVLKGENFNKPNFNDQGLSWGVLTIEFGTGIQSSGLDISMLQSAVPAQNPNKCVYRIEDVNAPLTEAGSTGLITIQVLGG